KPSSYDPEVVHARQVEYYLRNQTPERKAEVITNLLSEPAVRAEAARTGSTLRHAAAEASLAAARHDQGRREHITADEPATGYLYERAWATVLRAPRRGPREGLSAPGDPQAHRAPRGLPVVRVIRRQRRQDPGRLVEHHRVERGQLGGRLASEPPGV